MSKEINKLTNFSIDIMADVSLQREKIVAEVDERLKKDYDLKESQFLDQAYDLIQKGLKIVDKERNEVVSKTLMENRVKLLSKRKAIIDEVFEKAIQQIREFTKTEEYKLDLLDRIKRHLEFLGEGNFIIYINYKDKELYQFVHDAFPYTKVFIEKRYIEMYGGVKIHNTTTNVYIDDSIAKRLEEEEENFMHYCGIEIEDEVGEQ
jgi:vacuolar-type H+-ATPase subunit E/Vma4